MGEPLSILELVHARAAQYDKKTLYHFIDTDVRWSFADVAQRAARVAGQLAVAGVEPGARVGLVTDDRAVFSDAFFGLQHLGAVPVPLGLSGRPGSAAWSAVLHDRVVRFGLVALATDPGSASGVAAAARIPALAVDGAQGNPAPVGPTNPVAFIQPSSGTTGDPKGIVISQSAVLAHLAGLRQHWELAPNDSGLSWLPLFHDMGLIGTVINPLYQGIVLHHWPTASFLRSPGRWLTLLDELNTTIAIGPPFALELVTRRWRRRGGDVDLSSIRNLLVGAEQIRPQVLEAFAETFEPYGFRPTTITPTYGLAEATLAVTAAPMGEHFRVIDDGRHRWVSCGRAIPGVEVRIDAHTGELLAKTPALMTGYLDDPVATEAAITDDWLHTGDAAISDDGEIVIVGRLKELINRNGERVAPADFELAVQGLEGVLPDRIVAFGDVDEDAERVVVLAESRVRTTRDEVVLALRSRLADAGLAADVVELVPPGFIPRTTSGKLRRGAARDAWRASVVERGESGLPLELASLRVLDER